MSAAVTWSRNLTVTSFFSESTENGAALEELAAWRLGDCFGEILELAKISFLRGAFA
jgi:hypothetical protein